ncbi:hypothetical protein OCB09_09750 [Bacillus cereus]|nr:hypothetical protein [Bacillus cereus]
MSMEHISKSIFITNTFAQAHPEEHIRLWVQFEKEVPYSKRSGTYGADNLAYVSWLKKQQIPVVKQFLTTNITQSSF